MPIYTDQTIAGNFDPGVPPALPVTISVVTMTIDDADGDGLIRPNSGDTINGSQVNAVWVGDTVTINGVTITGVTFYTNDGARYFTPSDGSVLIDGASATAVTAVSTSTQFPVGNFGPPCFVAGTRIAVPGGTALVEDLRIGDFVETLDHGAQRVRWFGQRTVAGQGAFAPIEIAAGTLGAHGTLRVSAQHCVLIADWRAELLFGETEVLCPAHLLVDGGAVRRVACPTVTYVHLMFDQHEIVLAEGLASESFLLGDYLGHEQSPLRAEIMAVFPEMAGPHDPPMMAARKVLRRHEAEVLWQSGDGLARAA